MSVFEDLQQLLEGEGARFRVLSHSAEGKSDEVARIRGTTPGQGAKAMLCKTRNAEHWVLAVLPGDQKLDFRLLAAALGLPKMTMASAEEATERTGCVIGAIPPFSPGPQVALVVDPDLVERHAEIAFNAGRLDRSMVLNAQDYVRVAKPTLHRISAPAA
ncbi:MAG: YbaK/prolyl-tRNA synthetase associated domain-containing protein [Comamonas sp.]|jgi:Ala-tRNA(Pro) deacylase|nr:YbaK/prolyl-tRNA synthetase associated domain-containing protein [Comamonas sp.]